MKSKPILEQKHTQDKTPAQISIPPNEAKIEIPVNKEPPVVIEHKVINIDKNEYEAFKLKEKLIREKKEKELLLIEQQQKAKEAEKNKKPKPEKKEKKG